MPGHGAVGQFAVGESVHAIGASVDGDANGAVLEATAALVSGAASAVAQQQLSGPMRRPARLRPVTQDAKAAGAVVVARATLLAGRATGSGAGAGVSFVRSLRVVSGAGHGDAAMTLPGALIFRAALVEGVASGERNLSDDELLILAEA